MNQQYQTTYQPAAAEAAEARFARRIAACLSENTHQVAPDVSERLRFAREKAVGIARAGMQPAMSARPVGIAASGAAVLGFARSRWWLPLASALPLVALLGGLVLIQDGQARAQISTAAEVDAALLGDDLPINAYRDPGFVEFLKTPTNGQ